MSKKKNKQERKKARHDRRVANRAKLKNTPTSRTTLKLYAPDSIAVENLRDALSKVVPRVHTESCSVRHPTWDRVLDRIAGSELRAWVHNLVSCPSAPQPALLLTGPDCSGKSLFHEAMGLLLPDHAVAHWPTEVGDMLQHAWLMVLNGHPERFQGWINHRRRRGNRYLKWCVAYSQKVDPLPGVQCHQLELLNTTIPRVDLLRRLEDEKDAFQRS